MANLQTNDIHFNSAMLTQLYQITGRWYNSSTRDQLHSLVFLGAMLI